MTSCNMARSRDRSATIRLSRPFSSSSSRGGGHAFASETSRAERPGDNDVCIAIDIAPVGLMVAGLGPCILHARRV